MSQNIKDGPLLSLSHVIGHDDDGYGGRMSLIGERLRKAAMHGRPLWCRPWIGPPAWTNGEAVAYGAVRHNSANQWYVAVNSGTCGVTEPVHLTGAAVSDGAVLWTHLGAPDWDPADDVAAPTITLTGSTSTPAGLNKIDVYANRGLMRINGMTPEQYATVSIRADVFDSKPGTTVRSGGSVAFWSDAPLIGFSAFNGLDGVKVYVDGRPLTADPVYGGAAGNYVFTANWASRKPRLYEIVSSLTNFHLLAIYLSSSDQIWRPSDTTGNLRGVFIGDSYLGGSGYGPFLHGNVLSSHFGRLIGVDDMWAFGIGGTGLLNPGAASYYTYRERLPQALALNPDAFYVYGSTNDAAYTQAALTTEALAFIDAIRAESGAPIFWFGPASINISGASTVDTAIAAAVALRPDSNVFYKSIITAGLPWITGSHNNSGFTWSSNVAQYISGDGVHPCDKGTMYFARRMANTYIKDMLPNIL